MTEQLYFHFSLFMHWRRKWQPTPVFLPGESQGQRSLVGCRLWGRTELNMTEATQQQQQTICLLSVPLTPPCDCSATRRVPGLLPDGPGSPLTPVTVSEPHVSFLGLSFLPSSCSLLLPAIPRPMGRSPQVTCLTAPLPPFQETDL